MKLYTRYETIDLKSYCFILQTYKRQSKPNMNLYRHNQIIIKQNNQMYSKNRILLLNKRML